MTCLSISKTKETSKLSQTLLLTAKLHLEGLGTQLQLYVPDEEYMGLLRAMGWLRSREHHFHPCPTIV